jgi:phosphoribosylformimino-5-aminoimidazole carboxamide ribotide isomerase
LVDLDGARTGHIVNHKILSQISLNTNLIVDYGGGIKSEKDIQTVFENGASMVTIGSLAVTNQQLLLKWLEQFGQERIIIGADVKDNHIAISGWLETTNTEIHTFVDFYLKQGAVNFLCTDISRDGMMTGTSNELYKELIEQHPSMHLIASGGVSSINDIPELERLGVHSVIIGKAFYEGLITINDLKKWIC